MLQEHQSLLVSLFIGSAALVLFVIIFDIADYERRLSRAKYNMEKIIVD
ncbi:MAG: hypothetical protein AB7O96_17500 [Pseudobdellovibrionaceae bacterium]